MKNETIIVSKLMKAKELNELCKNNQIKKSIDQIKTKLSDNTEIITKYKQES